MNHLDYYDKFVDRHVGPNEEEISKMLSVIGISSLDELIDKTVPASIKKNIGKCCFVILLTYC